MYNVFDPLDVFRESLSFVFVLHMFIVTSSNQVLNLEVAVGQSLNRTFTWYDLSNFLT